MKFKEIKKTLRKPILWISSFSLFILLIILLCINLPSGIKSSTKLLLSIESILNFIFVLFTIMIFNFNKRGLFLTNKLLISDDETKVEFKVTNFIHIFIWIYSIGIYFIEISSSSLSFKIPWTEMAGKTWWYYLILFVINIITMYLFFYISNYLLNNTKEVNDNFIEYYKSNKK